MKKYKGHYILLLVVVTIWAVIGFRLIKYLSSGKAVPVESKAEKIDFQPDNLLQDSFVITANYRDPFLGEMKKENHVIPKPKLRPPIVKSNVQWPSLAFHGIVKNNSLNKAYCLITINGKIKTVCENDEVSGITVLSIERDSIMLSFNDEKKILRKNVIVRGMAEKSK